MNIPENCIYTNQHEWIRIEGSEVFIGITDYAQGELGDIVYIEVETVGEKLGKDEIFGTMPISGEVLEFNEKLEDNAELVNTDPYGEGWMVKIGVENAGELDGLLSPEQYRELITS